MCGIVEFRILHQREMIVGNPFLGEIGPVTDVIRRLRPCIALRDHHMARQRIRRLVGQQFGQIGGGMFKLQHQRLVVDGCAPSAEGGSAPEFTPRAFLMTQMLYA